MAGIGDLTAKELAEVEKLSRQSVMAMEDKNAPKMNLLIALAFVLKRREDPKVKYADVENMSLDSIMGLVAPEEDEAEFPGEAEG